MAKPNKAKKAPQAAKTVSVSRFRYVLDWFHVDEVELSLGTDWSYELSFRLGSWFVEVFQYRNGEWRNNSGFQLDCPADAVIKLESRIRSYSRVHDCQLTKEIGGLMRTVEALKLRAAEQGGNHA